MEVCSNVVNKMFIKVEALMVHCGHTASKEIVLDKLEMKYKIKNSKSKIPNL